MNLLFGEIIALLIFMVGVFGVILRRNILKTVISISIMQNAVILYFLVSDDVDKKAPILEDTANIAGVADPYPQALMITAIVIGVAVTAIALTMFINLYHKYGTTNWEKARKVRVK